MPDVGCWILNILGMEKISQNEGFEPVQTLRRLREGCGISALPAMILEKIKKTGYNSLNEEEKKFLDDASQK